MPQLTQADLLLILFAAYILGMVGSAALVAAAIAGFGRRLADAVAKVQLKSEFVHHKIVGDVKNSTFSPRVSLSGVMADSFDEVMLKVEGNGAHVSGNRLERKELSQ